MTTITFDTEIDRDTLGVFPIEVTVNLTAYDVNSIEATYFCDYWNKRMEFDLSDKEEVYIIDKAYDIYWDLAKEERR